MLWLSEEAIEYAVAKCRRERGYRIVIAVPDRNRIQNIECILRNLLRDTDEVITRRRERLDIEFNNGSYIKTLIASDSARGHRGHLLIADKDIDDEIINCVLRPYETLECIERQRRRQHDADLFRAEYLSRHLSRPIEPIGLWERGSFNIDDDKEFTDVSEEEFMNILNV